MCCFAIWEEYCTCSYCKITNTVYATDNIVFETFEAVYYPLGDRHAALICVSSHLLQCIRITGYVLHIILYTVHCTVYKEKCPVFLRIGRARAGFKAKNRCAVYTPWSRSLRWADTLLDNLTCYCFALFEEIVHHFPLFD